MRTNSLTSTFHPKGGDLRRGLARARLAYQSGSLGKTKSSLTPPSDIVGLRKENSAMKLNKAFGITLVALFLASGPRAKAQTTYTVSVQVEIHGGIDCWVKRCRTLWIG